MVTWGIAVRVLGSGSGVMSMVAVTAVILDGRVDEDYVDQLFWPTDRRPNHACPA